MIRVVHYVNQFFGQIGGEEQAIIRPRIVDGAVGPGILIDQILGGQGRVISTVICGDNYIAEKMEPAVSEILLLMKKCEADIFLAGPAFNAGRYGLACGELCARVKEELHIPAVTGMFPENPAVDFYRRRVHIIETANSSLGMVKAMPRIVSLGIKLITGAKPGPPGEEGYIPQGFKENVISGKLAAERAIELLMKKMAREPYESEITFPELDLTASAPPVPDLKQATIALVTEGGLVPKGNPDRIEGSRATKWGKYRVDELKAFGASKYMSVHRGFDTCFVNEDCNRLLPVDVMTEMEQEGRIKRLHPFFFTTTGVATTIENGHKIGRAIATELVDEGVSGALVIAT
jgi:glycine reductase